jgi:PIN domain nuclease of toxin-antitoxin system
MPKASLRSQATSWSRWTSSERRWREPVVLCDTHILIWHILDDSRLTKALRARMETEPEAFAVSAVSSWELALLIEKGRREATPLLSPRTFIDDTEFVQLPFTSEIAILSPTLPFPHEDLADRFLAAAAFHHGIPLATKDKGLHGISWLKTLS